MSIHWANALPINELTTGQISDFYPNLFALAGWTFAIWGLIYMLLAGYTLYQLGVFQDNTDTARGKLLNKIGILFSISSIANATVLLVSLNWQGFGLSEPTWASIIIILGFLIGAVTMLKNRDVAYGLVIVWAYASILSKHISTDGFGGQYPLIIHNCLHWIATSCRSLSFDFKKRE
ncbi:MULTISPECIES: hypothetical protein [Methanohalophilus]|uniref:Uncharacterized protein n=1 Tax=Methanohalophilus euhalobius TaxID=51203 RepID=A0A285G3T4_9EURY|nr:MULTISPECIES: hypothetical protein [Methanohalophilus]RSD33204.1 MAG: hypothetical protein CI952_1633 [Methanohalophilus sp.]SNY17091.1 hypothetical protein SAMN06295989_10713 [Methanohalophilus euhalobius]